MIWQITTVVMTILVLGLSVRLRQLKAKHVYTGLFGGWPIEKIAISDIDPVFARTPLGPKIEAEVRFNSGYGVRGGVSDLETWVLCVLAKASGRIFEFGTYTGKTTYLLAANSGPTSRVTTITLRESDSQQYQHASGDSSHDRRAALREASEEKFYYTGTPEETKITQLFGDSKQFDESAMLNCFDLIFVDGSHAASYVESDSKKALAMIRPGGFVIWHDYRGPSRAPGVFRVLNRIATEVPLRHIEGTSLVLYRKPSQ